MPRTFSSNREAVERIRKIREDIFGGNNNNFADKIGIAQNTLSAICTGKSPIGYTNIMRIVTAIPEINARWLLTGEGEMLRDLGTIDVHHNQNIGDIMGSGATKNCNVHDETWSATISQMNDTIRSQSELLKQQSNQISRLLEVISKMQ